MADKRTSKDEELIKNLRRKLDWYTYEATEEEFDEKQVQAILDLLDALDPLPDARVMPDGSIVESAAGDNSSVSDSTQEDTAAGVSIYDAQAALQRFQKKYNISDADLAGKTAASVAHTDVEFGKELSFGDSMKYGFTPEPASIPVSDSGFSAETAGKNGRTTSFFSRRPGRIAVAACLMLLAMAAGVGIFSINGSADRQHPFLEVVRDGIHSLRITVTGSSRESETVSVPITQGDRVYYDSWEEVQKEYDDILIPKNLPKGLKMQALYREVYKNMDYFKSVYISESQKADLIIKLNYYQNEYGKIDIASNEGWELIEDNEVENMYIYKKGEIFRVMFLKGRGIYIIEWDDLEAIKQIAYNMME